MSRIIGIDLGTANTLIYLKNKGIVLREPSVVAIDTQTYKVQSVGAEAREMIGKTSGGSAAFRPLRDGVIAEFDVTAAMLRTYIGRVVGNVRLARPRVIACIPHGVTEVEKRAVEEAVLEAGAKSVAIVEEPVAAAIGAGLRIGDAHGSMIVDIGGGTTEVAVISLGEIVRSDSVRIAGDELDEAIVSYVKYNYNILIGDTTAEKLKTTVGSVHKIRDNGSMEVRGRNLLSGLPAVATISSGEIKDAMEEQIEHIVDCIRGTLEKTPPELSADIYDDGITLSGGGALLSGLPELLHDRTQVRITVAPNPLECVITGIGEIIESSYADRVSFRER